MRIGSREIGPGHPVYIVAEMSGNHGGKLDNAVELVHAAKECGADAIKLQTYTPDTMTLNCDRENFKIKHGLWAGRTLYDLYKETQTPWAWHRELARLATDLGLDWFSTPFDATAVDFLEKLNVPAYKISSFELTDTYLLKKVAATGKPVILSTGMATLEEIHRAVNVFRLIRGWGEIALLKCVSAYPAPPEEMNLRALERLDKVPGVTAVGLSDHTRGIVVPIAAVALGANIVEKHLALPIVVAADSAFSLLPAEFAEMVQAVRTAECALASVGVGVTSSERDYLPLRRALHAAKDIKAGEQLTAENVRALRSTEGQLAIDLSLRTVFATRDLQFGEPLSLEDFE